jgi:hypothetical protein
MDMKKTPVLMTWIPTVDLHALSRADHLPVVAVVLVVAREVAEEIMATNQITVPMVVEADHREEVADLMEAAVDHPKEVVNLMEVAADMAVMMNMEIQDLIEVAVGVAVAEVPGMKAAEGMRTWIRVVTEVLHQEEVVMMTTTNHVAALIIEMKEIIMDPQAVAETAANHKNVVVNPAETDKLFSCKEKIPLNPGGIFFGYIAA